MPLEGRRQAARRRAVWLRRTTSLAAEDHTRDGRLGSSWGLEDRLDVATLLGAHAKHKERAGVVAHGDILPSVALLDALGHQAHATAVQRRDL